MGQATATPTAEGAPPSPPSPPSPTSRPSPPGRASPRGLGPQLRAVALYGGLAFVLGYAWMFSGVTVPNERSRVYLAVSLVDHGTLSIDPAVERFGPIIDWARHDGRFYTDKAPGSSLLGAIPYALVRAVTPADAWTIEGLVNLERVALMIPLSLLGFFLVRRLLGRFHLARSTVDLASLGWLLGTTALHYASAYYGHQIVAVCLLGAVLALEEAAEAPPGRGRRGYAVAGLWLGLAGLTEYQAAAPCVALAALAVWRAARGREVGRLIAFGAGVAPFAAAFVAYHAVAFGGPFELSYHHLVAPEVQALHHHGVGGVALPTWAAVSGSLVSLHRGLLITSPLILLAIPGLLALRRRGGGSLALALSVVFGLSLFFVFGAAAWYGGWSYGPRLLVPVMGLAVLPVALGLEWAREASLGPRGLLRGAALGLIAAGVVQNGLVHAFFREPPEHALNPLLDVVAPMWAAGVTSPNLVTCHLAVDGVVTLVPAAAALLLLLGLPAARYLADLSRRARAIALVGALAAMAPIGAAIALSGPSWDQDRRDGWVEWTRALEAEEYRAKP